MSIINRRPAAAAETNCVMQLSSSVSECYSHLQVFQWTWNRCSGSKCVRSDGGLVSIIYHIIYPFI